jgi:glutamate-1-semialdehyde aminotransferase
VRRFIDASPRSILNQQLKEITKRSKVFHGMLQAGVYIAPSAYESWFITDALSYEDLDYTIAAEIVAKTL